MDQAFSYMYKEFSYMYQFYSYTYPRILKAEKYFITYFYYFEKIIEFCI